MSGPGSMETRVIDASAVVEALLGDAPHATWAVGQMTGAQLAAPHHMLVEVANSLRRAQAAGRISADVASLAHADLLALPVDLYPYEALAERAWDLRAGVTCFDACYIALAELVDADLVTVDGRLTRAPGTTCRFRTPPT